MIRIDVKVITRSRSSVLEQLPDGKWVARIKAPPVDGKANAEVILLVARQFGVPRSRVWIRTGEKARHKVIEIEDGP